MKKKEVVDLMMKNKEKFSYIKMAVKKEAKPRKPRATKEEKENKKAKETSDRLQKALKLWEKNKKDNVDPKGNATKGYQRLKERMQSAKTMKEINKRIDQFSQVAKIKV